MKKFQLIIVSLRIEYLRGWTEKNEAITKLFWRSVRKIST